jgi:cytochrome oxidase Cu insertion factor (SCO1/SenC/PrrC family)
VPRTLADFNSKLGVLFFGYAQSADLCPTTLSDEAAAFKPGSEPGGPKPARLCRLLEPLVYT